MIKLENITKEYMIGGKKTVILSWINLEIKKWEFLAIMWPSWSGKSTLMHLLWFLDNPTAWVYKFNDREVQNLSENEKADLRRDYIWFVFQDYNLLSRMKAYLQVGLPLSYKWIGFGERYEKAVNLLWRVWLSHRLESTPDMLSGWEQQRVAIARSLANEPQLILADEPTWSLDTKTGKAVLELFLELHKEGKTIVVITHDPQVASVAQRTIRLLDGQFTETWEVH